MLYFSLNIPKTNKSIEEINRYNENIKRNVNDIYGSLKNVDSGWNDNNADAFIQKLKKDKYDIENYLNDMKQLLFQVKEFVNNIDNICCNHGYRRNTVFLRYDDDRLDLCKDKLNNVINYLNRAQRYASSYSCDSYDVMYRIRQLINGISSLKNEINNILNKLNSFTTSIERVVNNSEYSFSRFKNLQLDVKPMSYSWKPVSFATKSIELDRVNTKQISGSKINSFTNEVSLNQIEILDVEDNLMDVKIDDVNMKNLNSNQNVNFSKLNDFNNQVDNLFQDVNIAKVNNTKINDFLDNELEVFTVDTKEIKDNKINNNF